MSNFAARLTELLEKSETSRLSFNDLQDFLTDHAPAIRDLVRAAESVRQWNEKYPPSRIYDESSIRRIAKEMDKINAEISEALAKLEEA